MIEHTKEPEENRNSSCAKRYFERLDLIFAAFGDDKTSHATVDAYTTSSCRFCNFKK